MENVPKSRAQLHYYYIWTYDAAVKLMSTVVAWDRNLSQGQSLVPSQNTEIPHLTAILGVWSFFHSLKKVLPVKQAGRVVKDAHPRVCACVCERKKGWLGEGNNRTQTDRSCILVGFCSRFTSLSHRLHSSLTLLTQYSFPPRIS